MTTTEKYPRSKQGDPRLDIFQPILEGHDYTEVHACGLPVLQLVRQAKCCDRPCKGCPYHQHGQCHAA